MAVRTEKFGPLADVCSLGELLDRARRAAARPELPDLNELGGLLRRVADAQNASAPSFRPPKDSGMPGGLLNLPLDRPVLVLPDLHARPGLLRRALEWAPPDESKPLLELLDEDRAFLLLLGDLFHSEGPDAPGRWDLALGEYLSGYLRRQTMDDEMARSLCSLDVLVRAMLRMPGRIACLKGNHDNSRNRNVRGDHGFYKFADEGAMCAAWFEAFSPSGFRKALGDFEDSLPLAARGALFSASHAEPAVPLSEEDVIGGAAEVVESLTWTANGQAREDAVAATLRSLLGPEAEGRGARWISGHRPVEGRYALRAGGLLVQIHAPFAFQGAWVRPDRPFDPDRDIRDL